MSQPDPYQTLRQRLGNTLMGRTRKKTGQISPKPVTTNTEFSMQERTYWDINGNEVVTTESANHYVLACGCRCSSLSRVAGICPACARSLWVRLTRAQRYVCADHICLRCRSKRLRQRRGGGFWRTLFAILVWPLFDVHGDHETEQPPE